MQPAQHPVEMKGCGRSVIAFEPVLFKEGEQGRLAEFGFPQDAEKGGQAFLVLPLLFAEGCDQVGFLDSAGFWSGTQTEVVKRSALRRAKLPVGDLVDDDRRFAAGADSLAVPTEGCGRFLVQRFDAKFSRQLDRLGAQHLRISKIAVGWNRPRDSGKR